MIISDFKSKKLRPIGLDIGHSSIKMIQLMVNGDQLAVYAAEQIGISPDLNCDEQKRNEYIISSIRRALSKGNFYGKKAVSCLSSGQLKITNVRINDTEAEKAEQILRRELSQRFGLNPDVDIMDYIVAGSVRQGEETKNELILFAADNQTIQNHVEMLEKTGIEPTAIDIIPCAMFRSFERSLRRQEDWENAVIFIDLGSSVTTVVFGRGGEISFIKQIEIGGDTFNRQIASKLGISLSQAEMLRREIDNQQLKQNEGLENQQNQTGQIKVDSSTRQVIVDATSSIAETLAKEISLCLRYYTVTFRGRRVEKAMLTGGCANERILLDVLRRQLSVNIEIAQPLRGYDLSNDRSSLNFNSDRRGTLSEWAVAVGLGLKGINSAKYLSCIN